MQTQDSKVVNTYTFNSNQDRTYAPDMKTYYVIEGDKLIEYKTEDFIVSKLHDQRHEELTADIETLTLFSVISCVFSVVSFLLILALIEMNRNN